MKRNNFIKALFGLPLVFTQLSWNKKPKEEVTFFTPEMLTRHNFGLFIINSKVKEITEKNVGYASTVSWKICYHNQTLVNTIGGKVTERFDFPRYGLTNFLTDGWFYPIGNSHEEVCNYLNNGPYGEKFRLMSKEEVLYIISNRKQGFL